jgi:hypothetical protein
MRPLDAAKSHFCGFFFFPRNFLPFWDLLIDEAQLCNESPILPIPAAVTAHALTVNVRMSPSCSRYQVTQGKNIPTAQNKIRNREDVGKVNGDG